MREYTYMDAHERMRQAKNRRAVEDEGLQRGTEAGRYICPIHDEQGSGGDLWIGPYGFKCHGASCGEKGNMDSLLRTLRAKASVL